MKCLVLGAQGSASPSFRVRAMSYAAGLEAKDVELVPRAFFRPPEYQRFERLGTVGKVRTAYSARQRLAAALEHDESSGAAMILRQADYFPSLGIEIAAASGRRLVYDVDDAIWIHSHSGSRTESVTERLKATRRKVAWLSRRADTVIAGNELIAQKLSEYSSQVVVIPSTVDCDIYRPRTHRNEEIFCVGWIGSKTTAQFLDRLVRPLELLAVNIAPRQVEFFCVGGIPPNIRNVVSRTVPWSPAAELDALARFDVGVMPLWDTPWTRGKCAFKAIQYMASGIPVVADDVGVSSMTARDGIEGFVASTEADWLEALITLADDLNVRRSFGAAGRIRAETEYSTRRWGPKVLQAISGSG